MRVVIDTNVLVSAVLTRGVPRKTLSHVMRFHTIVCSIQVLDEYRRVLRNSEFDHYVPRDTRLTLLKALEGTEIVHISESLAISRDPDDDMIIETALKGNADVLVTGDSDILSLRPLHDIDIVTPAEFVKKYT